MMRSGNPAKAILAAAAIAALAAPSAFAGDSELIVGACAHFGQGKGILEENLSLAKQAGLGSLRDDVSWGGVEREKGKLLMPESCSKFINRELAEGVKPLVVLVYGNRFYDDGKYPVSQDALDGYARYAAFVASSFKGKGCLYQVWNEWDGGCGMAGAEKQKEHIKNYMKLLAAAYPKIKEADPDAVVIANSFCTGDKALKEALDLGLLKFCDVAALHTYNFGEANGAPENWLERMKGVQSMLRDANGGKDFPLYITEMGWPTHLGGSGRDRAQSADYLARLYLLAKSLPYIKGIWWYDFQDDGWDAKDAECNFGLLRPDGTPKESYCAMKDVAPYVAKSQFVEMIQTGDANVLGIRLKAEDGQDILAFWSVAADNDWQITLRLPQAAAKSFETTVPGKVSLKRLFSAREWAGNGGAKEEPGVFRFLVGNRPCVLKGDFQGVKLAKVERKEFQESMRPGKYILSVPGAIAFATPEGAARKVYKCGEDGDYRRITEEPRRGKNDLDAAFSASWSKEALTIEVDVTDDIHSQEFSGMDTWKGDGLQMAFQIFGSKPGDFAKHSDFDVALCKSGVQVCRQFSHVPAFKEGPAPDVKAQASRNGAKTKYSVKIPAQSLCLKEFRKGMALGFSLVVNDNDGSIRKGYLHWGDGIALGKNPAAYNWISLEE